MPKGDHIYNCYAPPPQEFVRGEGPYLYTEDGERYSPRRTAARGS